MEKSAPKELGKEKGRLLILVSAFVIGLAAFGFLAWLTGRKLWPLDAVLAAFVMCCRLQRWGEKNVGWNDPSEKVDAQYSSKEISKRRLVYSVPGIVAGLAAVGILAWLNGEISWIFEAIMGGLGGYDVATQLGEKFKGLPTLNDLALARMREGMSPLDLKDRDKVPITLKAEGKVKAKR